jgi:hypothetical protein
MTKAVTGALRSRSSPARIAWALPEVVPMRKYVSAARALTVAGLSCSTICALAESTYGYSAAASGPVVATARVNLSITVSKLILLRVGAAGNSTDTVTWTVGASIPAVPTTPVTGNSTTVTWDGTAPTFTPSSPAALTVYAWTNSSTPTINCSMGSWSPAAGGPANANFTVTSTGTLPHPGANLGACASTAFGSNTVATGTWQYVLGGTPGSWAAGVYTNTITYTAQGL